MKRLKDLETENTRLRKAVADLTLDKLAVSERRVCVALGQHRSTQRKTPRCKRDDDLLMADIVALAQQYGRYGYRRITALLRDAGWVVNAMRIEPLRVSWRLQLLRSWSHDESQTAVFP